MAEMPETAELLSFTKAIEASSLSRAAAELAVPRATLARRLARLEEKLGVRLLRRTTRALALTDAGEAFYRHARIVLDAMAVAEESVRASDERLRGTLRISVPPMLDESFARMVTEFARAHPDVQVHVNASARHVDLVREGFDLALRSTGELDEGLVARTLARTPILAVASPAYLRARGTPKRVEDLRSHTCLLGYARGEVPNKHWPLVKGGRIAVDGSFFSNDITILAEASRSGLGIAVLPAMLVGGLLRSGALMRVLPKVIGADTRLAVVYPEKELLPAHVRAFVEALVAWAPEGLAPERYLEKCEDRKPRKPRTRSAS